MLLTPGLHHLRLEKGRHRVETQISLPPGRPAEVRFTLSPSVAILKLTHAVLLDLSCPAAWPGLPQRVQQADWLAFAALLWVAMLRMRFDQARLLVILSDGAEWIRSLARWLPIDGLLILDLFHAKHRIWEVAHSLYGEGSAKAKQWAHTQCERVEQGGGQAGHPGAPLPASLPRRDAQARRRAGHVPDQQSGPHGLPRLPSPRPPR